MLFLLRLAFWILVICLLLPGSREDNGRLISSAGRTVNDLRGFCQRNPQLCEDARLTMTAVFAKLKSGADLLQSWLAQQSGREEPYARPEAQRGMPGPQRAVPKWQDSLNPADKEVPWRGPAPL